MGRYMNHSGRPNIRHYPPMFVRGKSRIGMYSICAVKKNEELVWNYGITTGKMPWKKSSGKSYISEHFMPWKFSTST